MGEPIEDCKREKMDGELKGVGMGCMLINIYWLFCCALVFTLLMLMQTHFTLYRCFMYNGLHIFYLRGGLHKGRH